MFKLASLFGTMVVLSLFHAKMLTVRNTHDPGSCSKSNHGELILVKDRENEDAILFCTESNGLYSWKTTDNSKPSGEYFNPGYDCLDIQDQNTKSKDGYYWVNFHGDRPRKVWCDMSTDGGGYMLIGHMNDTETWDVPSNNKTVQPFGPTQWSSEFGDITILDFRIQVASNDDFKNTKSHWAFRFKNKRPLKKLMIVNEGGCADNFPGVGDISYVKDLMTEEIVSKSFSCSIFGAYSHPIAKIGWTMMNICLEKPCPNGFAYHPLYPIQVDFSGGFSFFSDGNSSKSGGGSTAFFGCDKGKCCSCYGPPGGKGIYCNKECKPTNGGTITKHASAWFWVRLNPPRKVWGKCMEYESEEENGDKAWYKLVGDRNIPVKGRCGKSKPLLNDGVVVVENDEAFKNIPAVTGLLAYRTDNQSLLVRKNDTWNVLAENEQVSNELGRVAELVEDIKFTDIGICRSLGKKRPRIPSGAYLIGHLQVYCELSSGWTLIARFSNIDSKNWIGNATFWFDRISAYGKTLDPLQNEDMISEAFWRTQANEFKITRSDDPTHTALLQTTKNCLRGQSFRQHITSFGNFRYESIWASNQCMGSCNIQYNGNYKSTTGFEMHSCDGDIQSHDYIGFWCVSGGDAAVMMIGGGGGSQCGRADHGIGITESDPPGFGKAGPFVDIGYDSQHDHIYKENEVEKSYSLNLWVR